MVAPNYPNCEQARLFYYDYLNGESDEALDEVVFEHISQCLHCYAETEELRKALETPVNPEEKRRDLCIIETLSLHFAYLDKWISCTQAKAFLPNLLIPELRIRVPTPITAHLAECPACSKDLEVIRRLQLEPKQLRRLGMLFLQEIQSESTECRSARKMITTIAALHFEGISQQLLNHLCNCSTCNETLYHARQSLLDDLKQMPEHLSYLDNTIKPADLFDCVVPYEMSPEYAKPVVPRELQPTHEEILATCLANIQLLHRIIYFILMRDDSGVMTCFEFVESASSNEPEKGIYGTPNDWSKNIRISCRHEEPGENVS